MVVPQLLAVGAVAIGGQKLWHRYSTTEHNRTLEKTHKKLQKAAPDATVYVDHIDVDAAGNPEGILDTNQVPDLILHKRDAANLVIEVETKDSLQNAGAEAEAQVNSFAAPGYRRVLVVPDDALDLAEEAVEDWDVDTDSIHLKTPDTVAEAL